MSPISPGVPSFLRDDAAPHHPRQLTAPLACVVWNPSKAAVTPAIRESLADSLRAAGFRGPVWLETTLLETGATQARLAVASGARMVVAVGGDGTVRAVAAGVAGSDVELGILPLGTANLAARNLGIPTRDAPAMIEVACRGAARPVDVAWVKTEGPAPTYGSWARPTLGEEHACLVVAGIGFDASLVASTRPALKARLKWGAYALAALENLRSPRMDIVLSVSDAACGDAEQARRVSRLKARCVLISNGGSLPAGITLIPQASMSDGLLDVAAIDTVAGLAGWTSLARQVLPPFPAHYADPGHALGSVELLQARHVLVRLSEPAMVEVDGELLAPTRGVRVRVQPGAVLIRQPATH